MGVRRNGGPLAPISAIGSVSAGSKTVFGTVPIGATATFVKNGTAVGAATIVSPGLVSYGPVALVAGDIVSFNWSMTGSTPTVQTPGTPAQSGSGNSGSTQPVVVSTSTPDALLAEDGTALLAEDGTKILIDDRVVRWVTPFSASENRANQLYNPKETAYTYKVSDSDMIVTGTSLPVKLFAPGAKVVNLWHSGMNQLSLLPDANGFFSGTLDLTGIPNGALWIEAHALQDSVDEASSSNAIYAGIHMMLRGGAAPVTSLPTKAKSLSLFFEDNFTSGLSSSAAKSAPAGVKWFTSQPLNPEGYGAALFAPDAEAGTLSPYKIIDGQLRMRCTYDPAGADTLSAYDPFNRDWIGACLSTSFPDSTTNNGAIGNGYYEVRMLCPLGVGTWPAFWLNDQSQLVARQVTKVDNGHGREIDIVEQYNLTNGYVATQHRWERQANGSYTDNATGFHDLGADQGKMGWAYHTFGALVTDQTIEYYFDGKLVATDPAKYDGNNANPSLNHIILTHALDGGWPVVVPPSGYYDLFVDYVRYYK